MRTYFENLVAAWNAGWDRFWFTPSAPQTVGLLRLLVGGLALYFAATFTPDLERLLGPQAIALPSSGDDWRFSVFYLAATPQGVRILHGVCLAALALMTVGLFSRVATVAGLLAYLSYVHRAWHVTSELEPVLAFMMFYLCFAPTSAAFSLDALLWKKSAPQGRYVSATIATRLIQLHLSLVLLMMGLAQLSGQVWWSGEAVWWLAARPESRLVDLTDFLQRHPFIMNLWTHAIVWYELAFAVLIWSRWARPILLAASAPVWASVAVATGMPAFGLTMFVATLAFLPPEILSRQPAPAEGDRLHATTSRPATVGARS